MGTFLLMEKQSVEKEWKTFKGFKKTLKVSKKYQLPKRSLPNDFFKPWSISVPKCILKLLEVLAKLLEVLVKLRTVSHSTPGGRHQQSGNPTPHLLQMVEQTLKKIFSWHMMGYSTILWRGKIQNKYKLPACLMFTRHTCVYRYVLESVEHFFWYFTWLRFLEIHIVH